MKPIIGITCGRRMKNGSIQYQVAAQYLKAIEKAGGIPIILPAATKPLDQPLNNLCVGLLLTGGGDPDPTLFQEKRHPNSGSPDDERDQWEVFLMRTAQKERIPIFGICRGLQMINVAFGGDLYQDLPDQLPTALCHMQKTTPDRLSHQVLIREGTKLHHIIRRRRIWSNSLHHQAVKNIAPGLVVSAQTLDGVVEAIECVGNQFILGVQWHPERLSSPETEKLFSAFIEATIRTGTQISHFGVIDKTMELHDSIL